MKSEVRSGSGMFGVAVADGSANSAVDVAVDGAIVSTGKVARGVTVVDVIVGVSDGSGVSVTVGVSDDVAINAAVAVSASGGSVSGGVIVGVADGVT